MKKVGPNIEPCDTLPLTVTHEEHWIYVFYALR